MKIYFERSGGFAGMHSSTLIDTQNLAPEESRKIENLVEKVDFFHLPAKATEYSTTKGSADYFIYKIRIQNGQKEHSVEYNEINIQPSLKPLISLLIKYL